ncbi:MAG: Na/Pi symporter [Raineya sp.]|jgi:sodium-dependent phosphate cotransporter|nr:Na/Pi symporter [Raineya sp.]
MEKVESTHKSNTTKSRIVDVTFKVSSLVLLTLVFLLALDIVIESLKILIGENYIRKSFLQVYNPFIGLFVGLLATALVQSSTLITSLAIALVAAGTLSIHNAVAIVIGANLGTTITCMLVSFGHVMRKKEFRKALAGSMLHVMFNLIPIIIIFPLEYYWGLLSNLSQQVASWVAGEGAIIPFKGAFLNEYISKPLLAIFQVDTYPISFLIIAIIIVFVCIRLFILMFKKVLVDDFIKRVRNVFWATKWKGFIWGTLITALVHSSTIVTSFLVTLIGSNKLSLRQAFPLIMGANLGTTVTALTASLGKNEAAISIAFAHFLFNVISVLLILPFPWIQNQIITLCRRLGRFTMQYRLAGFIYVLIVFFLIPFILIYLHKNS